MKVHSLDRTSRQPRSYIGYNIAYEQLQKQSILRSTVTIALHEVPNGPSLWPRPIEAANRDRKSVMIRPTEEKSLSDWAELADMQKRRRATCAVSYTHLTLPTNREV